MQDNETVDLQSTTLYKEDWLGLKSLDEQGKLVFLEQEGDHMDHYEVKNFYTENNVIPFLILTSR